MRAWPLLSLLCLLSKQLFELSEMTMSARNGGGRRFWLIAIFLLMAIESIYDFVGSLQTYATVGSGSGAVAINGALVLLSIASVCLMLIGRASWYWVGLGCSLLYAIPLIVQMLGDELPDSLARIRLLWVHMPRLELERDAHLQFLHLIVANYVIFPFAVAYMVHGLRNLARRDTGAK